MTTDKTPLFHRVAGLGVSPEHIVAYRLFDTDPKDNEPCCTIFTDAHYSESAIIRFYGDDATAWRAFLTAQSNEATA